MSPARQQHFPLPCASDSPRASRDRRARCRRCRRVACGCVPPCLFAWASAARSRASDWASGAPLGAASAAASRDRARFVDECEHARTDRRDPVGGRQIALRRATPPGARAARGWDRSERTFQSPRDGLRRPSRSRRAGRRAAAQCGSCARACPWPAGPRRAAARSSAGRRRPPDAARPPASARARAPRAPRGCGSRSWAMKRAPWRSAFSIMPSSTSALSAARAIAQASGLPPKVLPCWPGFSTPSTSEFESTADTG